MSLAKINISQMGIVVGEILDEYKEYTTDNVKEAVKAVAKESVNELKRTSPRRTGKYAESWKAKITGESSSDIAITIYSPTQYRLTHLLENGHAKRGGGRVAAIPHIAPVQDAADMLIEEELQKRLKG